MRHSLLCLPLLAGPVAAQNVEVRLREESSRVMVAGAIVRLMDGRGLVAQGLSDISGRIVLRAPRPGTYHLRADRIGHVGLVTDPFGLGPGEVVRRELVMPRGIRMLPTLVVTGESFCGRDPAGGSLASLLWDDVRKALTAERLTVEGRLEPLLMQTFVREVDRTGTVLSERESPPQYVGGPPFRTLPPSELAQIGFIRYDRDSIEYAAPDAALLLSEEFVRTHCFRGIPPHAAPPGRVGLAFEPAAGRRVPEVQGVLWLDLETRELQELEYTYVGVRPPVDAVPGGRIGFRRLPNGTWMVHEWQIRMPRSRLRHDGLGRDRRPVRELSHWVEQGGRASPVHEMRPRPARAATLTGIVHDSVTGAGLPGAVVQVAGQRDSAVTGPDGRFQLHVVVMGDRWVTVRHPRLNLIPDGSARAMVFRPGADRTLMVSVPPLGRFVQVLCGGAAGTSGVIGLVRGVADRVEERTVVARWDRMAGGVARRSTVTTESAARGLYAFCELPAGPTLQLGVEEGDRVTGAREVVLGEGRWVWVDIVLSHES
jgi:hypothetical protein